MESIKGIKILIVGSDGAAGTEGEKELDFPSEADERLLHEIFNTVKKGAGSEPGPAQETASKDTDGIVSEDLMDELDTVYGKQGSIAGQVARVIDMDEHEFDVRKAAELAQRITKARMEALIAVGRVNAELAASGNDGEEAQELLGSLGDVVNNYSDMTIDLEDSIVCKLGLADFFEDDTDNSKETGNTDGADPEGKTTSEVAPETKEVLDKLAGLRTELEQIMGKYQK